MFKMNSQFILIIFISLLILNIVLTFQVKAVESSLDTSISLNSKQLKQGKALFIRIENNHQIKKITFNKQEYQLEKDKNSDTLIAFIPLSYWLNPGNYQLKIYGDNNTINKDIEVLSGGFKKSYITVNSSKEELVIPQKKETVERKHKDNQLISEARKNSAAEKLWKGKFIWPVKDIISTPFGATRYVNGKLNNRHSGIDIAAPRGTAIKATASGIVKLSTELIVTGNTIIIDHGWNIFSSYSHLDSTNVTARQEVTEGDIIGSIGSTGFSTGPHLHWTVTVNGIFINPEQFIEDYFTL